MKQDYLKLSIKTVVFITSFFFACVNLFAQEEPQDSSKTGNFNFKNPSSIVYKYTYDPITNTYIYTEKVGEVNVQYPLTLTPDEFQARIREEQMKDYFKDKFDAVNARGDKDDDDQRNLLP